MSDYRRWTSEEEQYIRDHWKTQSDAEMATALKRMEGAVRAKRRELRCSPQKTWTPEEERYHIGETAVNFDSDLSVFPISDCYAAREDAQAALDAVASRGPQLKEENNAET